MQGLLVGFDLGDQKASGLPGNFKCFFVHGIGGEHDAGQPEMRDQLVRKVGSVRDPKTGAAPKLRVTGHQRDDLKIEVEGSPALIEAVKRRLA